jgi:hypothetical protein
MYIKMLSKPLATIALLAISALGELSGFSTVDRSFGAMIKRQGGYYPTTHLCGAGATCAEACGLGQITCPSSFGIFCYDPTIGDTCCPNLAGGRVLTFLFVCVLADSSPRLLLSRLLLLLRFDRHDLLLPRRHVAL